MIIMILGCNLQAAQQVENKKAGVIFQKDIYFSKREVNFYIQVRIGILNFVIK